MNPKPSAYLVTGPELFWSAPRTVEKAMSLKAEDPRRTVEALVTWADCGRAMQELRVELAEAETLIAALAGELALVRQRMP